MNNSKGFKMLGLIILIAIVSWLTTVTVSPGQTEDSVGGQLADRVRETKVIRAGYVVYPPSFIKDPNTGEISGITADILEKAADKLGYKVEWVEETGWGEMIAGLKSGRFDIIGSPVWINTDRIKEADFTRPLYYSVVNAYKRVGDDRIRDVSQLNSAGFILASVDGESSSLIVSEDFADAGRLALPQDTPIAEMLLNVTTGKADVAFVEPAIAAEFTKTNPGQIESIPSRSAVRSFPNSLMFNKGETEFKRILDTSLEGLILDGFVDRTISKYEEAPNLFARVALPYQVSNNQ